MYMQLFSNRLKDLMDLEGESNRSLSIKIGADRKSIRCWLSGKFFPKYDALIKLSIHFKVRVDYLIGLEEVLENEPQAPNNATPIAEVPQRFLSLMNNYITEPRICRGFWRKNPKNPLSAPQKNFFWPKYAQK